VVTADILSPRRRRAVEALGLVWGDRYDIGAIRGGVYYARRDDGTGEALEADTPEAPDAAIRADQSAEVRS
jgi:hypothetical protein